MVNSPLIRPYLLGGSFGGGTLDSHEKRYPGHGPFLRKTPVHVFRSPMRPWHRDHSSLACIHSAYRVSTPHPETVESEG